jgi:hypothetical protein
LGSGQASKIKLYGTFGEFFGDVESWNVDGELLNLVFDTSKPYALPSVGEVKVIIGDNKYIAEANELRMKFRYGDKNLLACSLILLPSDREV